jgi:hypothetical protein
MEEAVDACHPPLFLAKIEFLVRGRKRRRGCIVTRAEISVDVTS